VTEGPLEAVSNELGPVDRDEPGPTAPADEPPPEPTPERAHPDDGDEGVDDR